MPAKKKTTRRSNKNFVAIPITGTIPILSLGDGVVVAGDVFGGNLTEDFYALSADIMAEIVGITSGEGNPTMAGFAHGDYTVTELKENLEVTLLGPGTKIEVERSRRLVRKTGMFRSNDPAHVTMALSGRYSDGGLTRTKLKFIVNSGKTLKFWAHNKSGAVYTTGANLKFEGTVYGRWMI